MIERDVCINRAVAGVLMSALLIAIIGCAQGPPMEVIEEANSAQKDFLLGPEDVLEIAVGGIRT